MTTTQNLFLIEFYTVSPSGVTGWDINLAWVRADNQSLAIAKLAQHQGARYDCMITCNQFAEIVPLVGSFRVNTPDANLFILA